MGIRRWLFAAVLLLPGGTAAAQVEQPFAVTVRLTTEAGAPIADALVRLVAGDSTIAQRLTDGAGLATFTIRTPGEYRFSAERMGYASWDSESMRLDGPRAEPIELRMREEAVTLEGIGVETEGRCSRERPLLVRAFGVFGRILGGSESAEEKAAKSALLARMHGQTMAALREVVECLAIALVAACATAREGPLDQNADLVVAEEFDAGTDTRESFCGSSRGPPAGARRAAYRLIPARTGPSRRRPRRSRSAFACAGHRRRAALRR